MNSYDQIKNLAAEDAGVAPGTIKTCFVAHVKHALGYPMEAAYNRKNEERSQPCPPRYRPSIAKAVVQVYGLPAATKHSKVYKAPR
jgi:hypothetical protein